MTDGGQLASILGAAIVAFVPIVKWLINDYVKKTAAIEELKEENSKRIERQVEKLQETIDKLYKDMEALESAMGTHTDGINVNSKFVREVYEKFHDVNNELMKSIGRIRRFETGVSEQLTAMQSKINQKVKTEIKTEVKKITEQLIMIKGKKKDGQS